MPRKIPTQVDQGLSRMLKGGFLKSQPTSYQTLLAYPPASLPPRAPFRQIPGDVPSLSARTKTSLEELTAKTGRDRMNSAKGTRSRMPKLFPQPIVYLADRVRERFYEDHPWETLRPRTLVEGSTVQEGKNISRDATSLEAWGKNPGPEDVVACTIHLHKNHSLSLSQAYHHTLSSYHAMRAEQEHASRSAILEAQSYGAIFAISEDGKPTAAVEIERGYRKETEELKKGAAYFQRMYGSASGSAEALSSVTDARTGSVRVKNATPRYSKGHLYLQAALDRRDGPKEDVVDESIEAAGQTSEELRESQETDKIELNQSEVQLEQQERVLVGEEEGQGIGR